MSQDEKERLVGATVLEKAQVEKDLKVLKVQWNQTVDHWMSFSKALLQQGTGAVAQLEGTMSKLDKDQLTQLSKEIEKAESRLKQLEKNYIDLIG